MNEQYEKLKEYVNSISKNEVSVKTQVDYIKTYTRLFNANKTPFDFARKSTHYKYRASCIYTNNLLANIKIEEIDFEIDDDEKEKKIMELNSIVEILKTYLDDDHIVYKKSVVQKSLSKKSQISTLKSTSLTLMLDHLKIVNSKYLSAVCVMFCTGCRPCELIDGVQIIKNKDSLTFKIAGKKTHANNKYGQQWREFSMFVDDPHYQYLFDKIDSELIVKIDSAKLLGEQIRSFSKNVVKEKTYISPYTYRHNFSNYLKKSGLDKDDIARCLSHCTDKSQNFYAHASNKKDNNGFRIFNIKATKSIKHVVNNNYIKSMATSAPCM